MSLGLETRQENHERKINVPSVGEVNLRYHVKAFSKGAQLLVICRVLSVKIYNGVKNISCVINSPSF